MNDTAKNFSWLALGDSYTIGQSVTEDERYPAQTVDLLKGSDTINVQTLQYIATTGWTTLNLLGCNRSTKPARPI